MQLFPEKTKFFFHVSKLARDKYNFQDDYYSIRGNLVITDGKRARLLSDKINTIRKSEGRASDLVTTGQINTMGLLHEIFHFLIRHYEEKENPGVFQRSIEHFKNNLTEIELEKVLIEFINEFPPLDVYKGKISVDDYLNSKSEGKANREIIIEEIILLHLENINPAAHQLEEFYSEKPLVSKTKYNEFIDQAEKFFTKEKSVGKGNLSLIEFLRKPIVTSPYNLDKQLDYILNNWNIYVYDKFGKKLLSGKDIIYEDSKLFLHHAGGKGTPPVPVYEFDREYFENLKAKLAEGKKLSVKEKDFYYQEYEKFTEDIDWMPNVVMIAKNAFVWLDQLSKKYNSEIKTLDQIPNEELDQLAKWNFTSLWLIGLWERSSASKKIKHLIGNIDAVSSAYSLFDYVIANELGGEEAFQNLKQRAWQRGIRLASDMVPNHTGIYSKWVIERPHYFIQTHYPPYPGYRFSGPNLSDDQRVEIRIEDKYYSMSDAAVVFERRDSYTGETRYIYHGNDGTHMPWNDTAQLNLLNPEVREALFQMIKRVASKTSIIRFDAAMTLTKKHYQRLWFPQPGSGGAIPSRSDFGITREEFDRAMHEEFWREVVDRINKELPNTLLLAEAFWLMEGYFVRTLGMHRVYNSAFMHMMMKEENEKYKLLIKNTLEFNPEILKRYVNFMSNPDEETAVNQFGKGDKYFGVAVMMVTLPGLPMFGHGQVEGFAEKYGMEYKRAYYNEIPDANLISRHEHEIFPLLKKRYLFSQVENFELYDFFDNLGNINENIFAFSNLRGNERTLVVYNNSYNESKGTIRWSSLKITSNGEIRNHNIADALHLKKENSLYYSYFDHKTKFEFLVSSLEIHNSGFFIPLKGYEYRVCLNFKEIYDRDGSWSKLYHHLSGKGVYSLEQELKELQLVPFHESIKNFLTKDAIENFKTSITNEKSEDKFNVVIDEDIPAVIAQLNHILDVPLDAVQIKTDLQNDFYIIRNLYQFIESGKKKKRVSSWLIDFDSALIFRNDSPHLENLLSLFLVKRLLNSNKDNFDTLLFWKALKEVFESVGINKEEIDANIILIKGLAFNDIPGLWQTDNLEKENDEKQFLDVITKNDEINSYIGLNEYEGVKYYNKERFENLINWILSLHTLNLSQEYFRYKEKSSTYNKSVKPKAKNKITKTVFLKEAEKLYDFYDRIKKSSVDAEYQLEKLISLFNKKKNIKTEVATKDISGKRKTKKVSKKKSQTKKRGKGAKD